MIYYIIYTSKPTGEITPETLKDITSVSEKNNPGKKITGMLLGVENKYLQYLEGPEENVNELFQKIWKDPRHQNVTQWIKGYSKERVFGRWSMGSWMLSYSELKKMPALADLKKFLDDPLNNDLQSKKFMSMMHDLLKMWIEEEAEH
ncbi:BLUF domain-containing protein [Ekhidna sp.]|uniref:BLUF domain-containing protein n=1 Tax=Ekhidna sp. TaxID=2608089 RepID=UPI0032EEEDD1